jgi:hypothetical protein
MPESPHPPPSNLEHDSAGQVTPRYDIVHRPIRRLTSGDLVIEPILGELRVVKTAEAGYDGGRPFVQVYWAADGQLSSAAGLYPADATLPVRLPAAKDRALIRRGIDRAAYRAEPIAAPTARLIAAHLHHGPGSALYAFAASGVITDRLYRELDEALLCRQAALRSWVNALACYCLSRGDPGPMAGWASPRW